MTPANRMAISSETVTSSKSLFKSLLTKCVIVQNKNNMVNALKSADIALIITEYLEPSPKPKIAATAPINWNKAAPGACVTSNFTADEMYSPQSQKLKLGSIVDK